MELCLNGITDEIRFSESPSLETSESAHADTAHSLLPKLTLSIASTLSTHGVLRASEKVNIFGLISLIVISLQLSGQSGVN